MNNQKATEILNDLVSILNQYKIPYFLSCGTLLGMIRDGKLIDGDGDIDIGMFAENWTPNIKEILEKHGYKFYRQLGTPENGLEYTFSKEGINVDIFFYYKEQNYRWMAAYWKKDEPEYMIKLKFDDFGIIIHENFNYSGNIQYFIPTNCLGYLTQQYGQEWVFHKQNWHWATSPKNIIQAPFDITKEKTICLGMIVKNEGKIIKESLESLKSIIDYWIIVDTGSTDNTKEIVQETLKDIPGELIDRPWINFGHNRTEVFNLAKNKADYTIMIDADMIVKSNGLNKYTLIADSYRLLIEGNPCYYLPLMFNNQTSWRSVGVTHEYWHTDEINVSENLNTISIDHRCNGDYRPEKFENDIKMLLKGLQEEPENARYMFYLAQSYKDIGEYDEAIKWYKQRIQMGGWKEEVFYSMYMIGFCSLNSGKPFEESVEAIFRAYLYLPNDAEPLYILLQHCRYEGRYNFGYYVGKIAEKIPMPTNKLFIRRDIYDYKILDELSICAYYVGKYKESVDLCNKILDSNLCPFIEKDRIYKNREFSLEKMKGER